MSASSPPPTADAEASLPQDSAPQETAPPARSGLSRIASKLLARAGAEWLTLIGVGLAGLVIAGLLSTAYVAFRRSPIVEYAGQTSILNFVVRGQDNVVWNLPSKRLSTPSIVDEAPVRVEKDFGIGALVMPEGTSIQVTRLHGEPLRVQIIDVAKDAPFLLDKSSEEPIELKKGSIVTLAGSAMTGDNSVPITRRCARPLPKMAFRGTGTLVLGAPFHLDAYDLPEDLAGLSDREFLDQMVQPMLASGAVFVFAQTLVTNEIYQSEKLDLQTGDVLRLGEPSGHRSAPGMFVVEVSDCALIAVRGVERTKDASIVRIGGDAMRIALSPWQIISNDTFISFLFGLSGFIIAVLGAYTNIRQLADSDRQRLDNVGESPANPG